MKRKLHPFEIVWYVINGGLALWGLTYVVLGVICRMLPTSAELSKANTFIQNSFGLGFFWWGIIIMWIGILLGVIVLLVFASKTANQVEKETRRAARLAKSKEAMKENKVVDVESTPKAE